MDGYACILTLLVISNLVVACWNHKKFFGLHANVGHELRTDFERAEPPSPSDEEARSLEQIYRKVQWRYLPVYVLAVMADWLQGPYIYAVYRSQHGLPDREIALLFITGFAAGALSSTFVGEIGDRLGRKKACIAYCLLPTLSSLSLISHNLRILFLGRVLGGVSTTLLFSAFETWLISDVNLCNIVQDAAQSLLKHVFGISAILNSLSAIVAGVASQILVTRTADDKAPFFASIACLMTALCLITCSWTDNYGRPNNDNNKPQIDEYFLESSSPDTNIRIKTMILCLFTGAFEGTMYVFVHFWPQALVSATKSTSAESVPPFGIIFASMMSAMCLGSFVFNTQRASCSFSHNVSFIEGSAGLCAVSLLASTFSTGEYARLCWFLVYEGCVGLYFPAIATLKAILLPDAQRTKVYALMRLPLNVFVLLALGTFQGGRFFDSCLSMTIKADLKS